MGRSRKLMGEGSDAARSGADPIAVMTEIIGHPTKTIEEKRNMIDAHPELTDEHKSQAHSYLDTMSSNLEKMQGGGVVASAYERLGKTETQEEKQRRQQRAGEIAERALLPDSAAEAAATGGAATTSTRRRVAPNRQVGVHTPAISPAEFDGPLEEHRATLMSHVNAFANSPMPVSEETASALHKASLHLTGSEAAHGESRRLRRIQDKDQNNPLITSVNHLQTAHKLITGLNDEAVERGLKVDHLPSAAELDNLKERSGLLRITKRRSYKTVTFGNTSYDLDSLKPLAEQVETNLGSTHWMSQRLKTAIAGTAKGSAGTASEGQMREKLAKNLLKSNLPRDEFDALHARVKAGATTFAEHHEEKFGPLPAEVSVPSGRKGGTSTKPNPKSKVQPGEATIEPINSSIGEANIARVNGTKINIGKKPTF